MRYLILLLLTGCVGTKVEFNPETKAITVERWWVEGPTRIEFVSPDGTRVLWDSDPSFDAITALRLRELAALEKALELASQAAMKGTMP